MIKGMLLRRVIGLVSTVVSLAIGYFVYTHYISNGTTPYGNPAGAIPGTVNSEQVKDQIQNQISH